MTVQKINLSSPSFNGKFVSNKAFINLVDYAKNANRLSGLEDALRKIKADDSIDVLTLQGGHSPNMYEPKAVWSKIEGFSGGKKSVLSETHSPKGLSTQDVAYLNVQKLADTSRAKLLSEGKVVPSASDAFQAGRTEDDILIDYTI